MVHPAIIVVGIVYKYFPNNISLNSLPEKSDILTLYLAYCYCKCICAYLETTNRLKGIRQLYLLTSYINMYFTYTLQHL